MSRSLFSRLLLVCALLFAQMGGVVHGIAHALEQHTPDHALSHDKHCELCEVYAQIGSAIGSSAPPLPATASLETSHFTVAATPVGGVLIAHPARAPPCPA